jgi:hypothetical protein
MQMYDGKLHPVRFFGRVLKENEINYHPAEREVLALLQVLKITHTLLKSFMYTPGSRRWNGSSHPRRYTEEPSASLYCFHHII